MRNINFNYYDEDDDSLDFKGVEKIKKKGAKESSDSNKKIKKNVKSKSRKKEQ